MGLVRSFIGTDGIWQYIPHINTGLFSIIKVHFLLFANLIVDWHINTINFTDSGLIFLPSNLIADVGNWYILAFITSSFTSACSIILSSACGNRQLPQS